MNLVWKELSEEALRYNFQILRSLGEGSICSPCVKANAYGHGLQEVVSVLQKDGCQSVTVSSVGEAQTVRTSGFTGRIIIINYVSSQDIMMAVELDSEVMVYDLEVVSTYQKILTEKGCILKVHLAVETGMGRYGIDRENIDDWVKVIESSDVIKIQGVMSHFATSDNIDTEYMDAQLDRFSKVEEKLLSVFPDVEFHISNSAGTVKKELKTLYRPGLALYGYAPSECIEQTLSDMNIQLRTVLTVKSVVSSVKELPQGHSIGYDCTYMLSRDSLIAVVPVGYSDGYNRALSNSGEVGINGFLAPVIGRVCMNLIMVDVTQIPDVAIGDEVTIVGADQNAKTIADKIDTISYEVLSGLRDSIPVLVV